MQKTSTFNLNEEESKKIFLYLSKVGTLEESLNPYVDWIVRGADWNSIMYKSGKLVVQCKDSRLVTEINKVVGENFSFEPHIGSDEVGKGDYFGPLVVCACYLDQKDFEKIKGYGVVDSKDLTDAKMLEMGAILKKELRYEIQVVNPKEYDVFVKKYGNISIVLAKIHAELIEKLSKRVEKVSFVVVDQFSKNKGRLEKEFKLKIPLKQYHHAESDIAVAAASIVARYFFLKEFEKMSKNYKMQFPLGATHVIDFAKEFVAKYGADELDNVAKVSFRTTQSVLTLF
jgi:ribonuclease HIII